MEIEKNRTVLWTALTVTLLVVGVVGSIGYKAAREHVDYVTSTKGFPLECTSCHGGRQYDTFLTGFLTDEYVSPFNLAVSPDGDYIYVVGREDNSFLVIDPRERKLVKKIEVGEHPHSVILDGKGRFAFLSNQWSDDVMKIRVPEAKIIADYKVGSGPSGLQWDGSKNLLYVVNTFSSDLSIVDLETGREQKRLPVGSNPTAAGFSPDGESLFVLSRRSRPVAFRTPPKVELSLISTSRQYLTKRMELTSAHILESVEYTPDGELALFTLIKSKNLVPAVQVESGWMINHGIGVFTPSDGKIYQLLLDEPNRFYADPYDVSISPDGTLAAVSHSGADYLSIIDMDRLRTVIGEIDRGELTNPENDLSLSNRFVVKRIKTGSAPKGIAFAPDGSTLYYAEYLTDRIGVVDMATLEITEKIKLGDADQNTVMRQGQRLFHSAGQTFQYQFSCYTCHPDGHEDGLTYDMALIPGRDITNVQTLRELSGTAPFKWNGHNVSVYMQDGMRFSKYVTRTEAFAPEELVNLTGYIMTQLKHPPNRYRAPDGTLTEAQKRGKAIFERTETDDGRKIPLENRCITCHPPPNFTNSITSDVGTSKKHDGIDAFDPPNLNNVYESAPYLHDGSAQTLEEIWTVYGGDDRHGVVNDLTKNQLNDLIEYLKSLGSAEYYK